MLIMNSLINAIGKWVLRRLETPTWVRDTLTEHPDESNIRIFKEQLVPEAEKQFLEAFSKKFLPYLYSLAVLLLIVFVLDLALGCSVPNQTYGLLIDLAGAIILGRGLLMGPDTIAAQYATSPIFRTYRLRLAANDAVDGVWGIFFLGFGIVLQLLAPIGVSEHILRIVGIRICIII